MIMDEFRIRTMQLEMPVHEDEMLTEDEYSEDEALLG